MNDYAELMSTGIGTNNAPVAPEDQFFHSIYIPGLQREENHAGILEQPGKIQIYGVQYNLDEANFIMMHTKQILVKRDIERKISCFSFLEGRFPKGTSGNTCPRSREERDGVDFCKDCRTELIMSGLYCNPDGTPIKKEDGSPIFVFLRGAGIKCGQMYEFLEKLKNLELDPLMFPDNPAMEISLINNKRYVTNIKPGRTKLKRTGNIVNIFNLDLGTQLTSESVKTVLDLQKETLAEFKNKFDYSLYTDSGKSDYSQETKKPNPNPNQEKLDSILNF